MLEVPGYIKLKKIAEGRKNIIYSAERESDNESVIQKTLRSDHPSNDDIALMYHEYAVTNKLEVPGVIKTFDLIEHESKVILVQEDVHGISLHEFLNGKPLDVDTFLVIAIQMADILKDLHRNKIIHKDLKPSNFIINPDTLEVKVTDFNYSSQLSLETQDIVNPDKIEGTLEYIAPEQTGRMNMNIDYRADFYSLGVTFYEMATGRLPFHADDPMEYVYFHMAVAPTNPQKLNRDFPEMLSQIICKLIEKNPRRRYQSSFALKTDLETCYEQWKSSDEIESFKLGQAEVHDRLNISQKLYGRDKEVKQLLDSYDRVSEGAVELVMVKGYSGIGKTMLINEVHKSMVKHSGYFIQGKFDQLERNTPFTAITVAFNRLAQQVLAEPQEIFARIKNDLKNALGDVGQVIIDIAPSFELVIGKQQKLESLPPNETQNRLRTFFQRFLRVLSSKEKPLVLFIDDLQWVDSGTLTLFESLLKDLKLEGVLLIGAYRDNEVNQDHQLMHFLEDIKKNSKTKIIDFELRPLLSEDYQQLIADTLESDITAIKPLSDTLYEKTRGNPFFFKQVLNKLYQESVLKYSYKQKSWVWELNEVESLNITDNVLDLMVDNLDELSVETKELLKYAACIGNRFQFSFLATISGKTAEQVGQALWPAMESSLIVSLRMGHKYTEALRSRVVGEGLFGEITYQFVHDQVQRAVYHLLSDEDRRALHIKIARFLQEKLLDSEKKERMFEILDHVNQAPELLSDQEKMYFAKLNCEAGVKARRANAYQSMNRYIKAGLKLTNKDWWEDHYSLMFDLEKKHLESLFLTGEKKEAIDLGKELLNKAKSQVDKANVYYVQMLAYITQGKIDESIEIGTVALEVLGVDLPLSPTKWQVLKKMFELKWLMLGVKITDFDKLPVIKDEKIALALKIMRDLSLISFQKPNVSFLTYYCSFIMILILRYGKDRSLYMWTANYALLLIGLNKVTEAFKFWDESAKLMNQCRDKYTDAIVLQAYAAVVHHYKYPLNEAEPFFKRSIHEALESGNLTSVVYVKQNYMFHELCYFKSLDQSIKTAKDSLATVQEMQQSEMVFATQFILNVLKCLSGDKTVTQDDVLASYQLCDKITVPTTMHGVKCIYNFYSFYSGNIQKTFNKKILKKNGLAFAITIPLINMRITLLAVHLTSAFSSFSNYEKRRAKSLVKRIGKKLHNIAGYSPANYLHHYLLVKGSLKRLDGCSEEAIEAFNQAQENAKLSEAYLWEALAHELAGEVSLDLKYTTEARAHLQEAHYNYKRYGMQVKVDALEKKYPQFFLEDVDLQGSPSTTMRTTSVNIDFQTIIKASQTLSGEIVLSKLLDKMLTIMIENAGAERAIFIEKQGSNWFLAATKIKTKGSETFEESHHPLTEATNLSKLVVNYAIRTKEPVVVQNAIEDSLFSKDEYVKESQSKSILCIPFIRNDLLVGLVYFENNLSANVFTKDRVTVLGTLSAQIAISLENAHHFDQMDKLYRSTERFVPKAFLELLNKRNVEEVQLGDNIETEVTALFTDIRDYTTITERQTADEAFRFINSYLEVMAPIIRSHNGFIGQYIGDAMMALFPSSPNDAIEAVFAMSDALEVFNKKMNKSGYPKLRVGYGLNTGPAIIGTIGESERMDANVISDAINTASRVESLTKRYQVQFLITDLTKDKLVGESPYTFRPVDKILLKGKAQSRYLFEVSKPEKLSNPDLYIDAFSHFERGEFKEAKRLLGEFLEKNPNDFPAQNILSKCEDYLNSRIDDKWDCTVYMYEK